MPSTAKVFWSRRSQAVRLPKEFRLDTAAVRVRRHGAATILESFSTDWDWLDTVVADVDPAFEALMRVLLDTKTAIAVLHPGADDDGARR